MPVDCLLGNELEHSSWKEVELSSHVRMLGLPEWVCVTTRGMAAQEESKGSLEPETTAQTAAKSRRKRPGKPALAVPPEVEEAEPEGPAPEPTGEDIAALGEIH